MLTIEAGPIHWLNPPTSEMELCAHATIAVMNERVRFVEASDADVWTVSIAALLLMRTIARDHTPTDLLSPYLIPCCGHSLYTDSVTGAIVNYGCNSGLNWWVEHLGDQVRVTFAADKVWSGTQDEWCAAIVQFADTVQTFYAAAEPKRLSNSHDEFVYGKFWEEWRLLRASARCAT